MYTLKINEMKNSYKQYRQSKLSSLQKSDYLTKMNSRIFSNTQSTSTCMSNYNEKISIKAINIINQSSFSSKGKKAFYYLNIKYNDIKKAQKSSTLDFLSKFFCRQQYKNNTQGCNCQIKCLWTDKWMIYVPLQIHNKSYTNFQYASIDRAAVNQIEKDLKRTQPNYPTFQNQIYIKRLRQTLLYYCLADKEVGYMQGMNIVASVLVYHSKCSYQALKLFEVIMKKFNLRQIYLNDLTSAKRHSKFIVNVLKYKVNDLYKFLVIEKKIEIELFVVGWLFSLMGSFIKLESMHLVLDSFIEKGWSGIYGIIITIFVYLKEQLMQREDQTQIMSILSIQNLKQREINWNSIILTSENFPIDSKQVYQTKMNQI